MRVLFLVALVAGAQALTSPSLQRRGGGSDTCGHVNCGVSFSNPYGGGPLNFGNIDQCACLSNVPSLVKSNSALSKASSVFGDSKVSDFINSKIHEGGKNCNYPDHCTPSCTPENPCGFQCTDGYTADGDKCSCKPPYKECNGKCGPASSCPSKSPHKRDADEWKRTAHCNNGHAACGVLWSSKLTKHAYECVDAENDLESCGGCSIPLHRGSPVGVDCTSLPGVADVSCMGGSCFIHKCMPGYELAVDNSMCMDDETLKKFTTIAEFGWEMFTPLGFGN